MKTLTQRVTLREMQILEKKHSLRRRCKETGFVYWVVGSWVSYTIDEGYTKIVNAEIGVHQIQKYRYSSLFSKNCFGGGGYDIYPFPVGTVSVADPNNFITEETIRKVENMLKKIDSKSRAFFDEELRVATTPALRAYEEKCATLYDSNGKFIRENVWTAAGYQDAHSQDVLSQNQKL